MRFRHTTKTNKIPAHEVFAHQRRFPRKRGGVGASKLLHSKNLPTRRCGEIFYRYYLFSSARCLAISARAFLQASSKLLRNNTTGP